MSEKKRPENGMAAYLFVDTFAFEKLASQRECRVGQRGAKMTGYETYIIEQWACERRVNTVVASYTGNSQHVVEVQVLLVPTDLDQWSPVTFSHFEELVRMHILPKETPLGNMLVTSLSSLPSNLSLINMTQQFRYSYAYFAVNENLRRMNVVGRTAVTAEEPSESTIATFRRGFMAAPPVSATYAVLEVGTLMQISLFYFGILDPAVIDGLLCDHTLKAIELWWTSFGRKRFKVPTPRPQDKLYMRISCAALVGTVTGARQRFSALGLKPPKDPFDAENFVECIRRFQKLMKLPKTSRLDDQTYFKLIQETAKISSLANSSMLNVMKSTVKEGLSGKTTEAVDDWETLNLEQLAHNVRGSRAKYLWQGKGSPKVPHLKASHALSEVGARTKIPLFSLSAEEHHHHRHSSHYQLDVADNTGESTHAAHSKSLFHNQHHPSPSYNETLPTHANENSEADDDTHPQTNAEASHDVHTSLVGRFRKRKPGLGDAFDEKASTQASTISSTSPGYAHMRSQSASSDNWFAKQAQQQMSMQSQGARGSKEEPFGVAEDPIGENSSSNEDEAAIPLKEHENEDRRCDIPVVSLLTRDDQNIGVKKSEEDSLLDLRRTASLSEIDQNLFPWDSLASAPKVFTMYGQAQALQAEVTNRINVDENVHRQVEATIKSTEPVIAETQRDNMLVKYHVNASLKKEDAVRRRVRELEAFMARLDYELATLSVKLKDVDQSVMVFAAKVDTLDTKWNNLRNMQRRPWWSRMLSNYI